MSDNQKHSRPKTGGKPNDRRNNNERGGRTGGGKTQKGLQPKFDDTQEAKKQKEKIARIDQEINKLQSDIERVGKVKVVVRKPRSKITNKDQILKEIESIKGRIAKAEQDVRNNQPESKRLLELVNEKRVAVNRLKTGVFFHTPNERFMETNEKRLREEVKRLEGRLETETLSIAEEKNVVREIKKVKAMKQNFEPFLRRARELKDAENQYTKFDRDFKRKTESLENYQKDIVELQNDLNSLEEREKEQQMLKQQEEKKQQEAVQKEKDEKTKLEEKLNELLNEFRQEKDMLIQMRDKWYQSKRQERDRKMEEVNQERAEKRREQEQEEKQKILQERQERRNAVPYNTEINVCQNLIVYLNQILNSTRVNEPKETKTEDTPTQKTTDKDQGYIKGKGEVEDLLFPESSGSKKKKKTNNKKKVPQKITHNWDTFTRFEEIGLGEPPITATQIPKAIEDIKGKLAEYQKKSVEERREILKKLDEEEENERKAEEEKKRLAQQREKEEKEKVVEPTKEEGSTPTIEENK